MLAAEIAVAAGIIVATVYLASIVRSLRRARREMQRHGGAQLSQAALVHDQVFVDQEAGMFWKAAAGLVLSTLALVLLMTGPALWYLVPFLSIATAIAVIAAFALDSDTGPMVAEE